MARHNILALMLAFFLISSIAIPAQCQEFRVESDVYLDKQKEPFSQHLTLFSGNLVYDFTLTGSPEVTILDARNGRMILLDVEQQKKAEVSTANLLKFASNIKTLAEREDAGELLGTKFAVSVNKEERAVELKSERITYRAFGTEAKQTGAVARYREFADYYARLNAMMYLSDVPPFGRLALNRALASQNLVPEEIERVVRRGNLFETQHVRSQHLINWQLTNTDRQRIRDVAGYQSSFREVSLRDYVKPGRVAAK